MTEVYRTTRPVSWAGADRHNAGDLIVDPPEFVPRKLGKHLERLDDDGRLPRETLRKMHYSKLQKLAAEGDVDDVNGNSKMEEIIDAYAISEGEDDAEESEE